MASDRIGAGRGSRPRTGSLGALRALLLPLLLIASPSNAAEQGAVLAGRVVIAIEGLRLSDAGAIVVFLEPLQPDRPEASGRDLPTAVIRQNRARFDPPFLVVARGQRIEMPNDDVIFHNVFSYSEPNAFDLGIYPAGQSRSLRFEHAGLIRIYCSIHEAMDGLIFVAPSRLFTRPGADGTWEIGDLGAGRYALHVWSERLPEQVRPIEIGSGERRQIDVEIGLPGSRDR
jgi:plastocyanin